MGEAIISRRGGNSRIKCATGQTTLTVTKIDSTYCYGTGTVSDIGFKPKIVILYSEYLDVEQSLFDTDGDKIYFTSLEYIGLLKRTEFTGTEFEFTNDGFKLTDYKLDIYYVNPDDTELGYSAINIKYIIYG